MIPQRNLSLLSNRLARKGDRRITEAILERDYCISWFLVGLSQSPLKNIFLFKGGTAIKKCYFPDYRFSEDLDFTLAREVPIEKIQKDLDIAFKHTQQASGIILHFSRHDRHTHGNSYTFFLEYEGPLPSVSGKEIKVDITIREKIVFPIEERIVLKGYDEYEDLPKDATVCVYSLAEIAAEKVIALLDRARNEPRDLYDIWYLTTNRYMNLAELAEAIKLKSEFRDKKLTDVREEFLRKEASLKKLWRIRLSSHIATLPEFSQAYRAVLRELRQAGFLN
ncbi:MAG: nucleotidyl transferase AbiEii/AbiGii toxin family protein [Deltaproteobacteria bacterium]|nr:nucleotidyl transferase AbiEii/AbiGii toxin family protein [Deltaproteobacteria bacterium]